MDKSFPYHSLYFHSTIVTQWLWYLDQCVFKGARNGEQDDRSWRHQCKKYPWKVSLKSIFESPNSSMKSNQRYVMLSQHCISPFLALYLMISLWSKKNKWKLRMKVESFHDFTHINFKTESSNGDKLFCWTVFWISNYIL